MAAKGWVVKLSIRRALAAHLRECRDRVGLLLSDTSTGITDGEQVEAEDFAADLLDAAADRIENGER
jgi:hypothetical protein